MIRNRHRRRGAVLVESALVYPILVLILLAIIVLGMAVFRYQQVAHISREASRWLSVRGTKYAAEQGVPAATATDAYNSVIKPMGVGMHESGITYAVVWNTSNSPTRTVIVPADASGPSRNQDFYNTVSVTVTYSWNTGIFGTIPVSSTSVNLMSY